MNTCATCRMYHNGLCGLTYTEQPESWYCVDHSPRQTPPPMFTPLAPQEPEPPALEPYYKITPLELSRIVEYTLETFLESQEELTNNMDAGTVTIANVRRYINDAQYRTQGNWEKSVEVLAQTDKTPACLTCDYWMPETVFDASAPCKLLNVNVMDTFFCKHYTAKSEIENV